MLASLMTDAVSPAALLPLPEVYTAIGACHHAVDSQRAQTCAMNGEPATD